MQQDLIAILDLGGTDHARLARAIRALGVYSEIYPHDIAADVLLALPGLKGVILNGGPNRVVDGVTIDVAAEIYAAALPVWTIDHSARRPADLAQLPADDADLAALLRPFLFTRCQASTTWNMERFIAAQIARVREQVGTGKVLLALSGGVDSSVVAALLIRAIGKQLHCVHVNHGLMRKGESEQVLAVFRDLLDTNLVYVDASARFLRQLAGVADPEHKRKIIGGEFIHIFEEEARKLDGIAYLAQGTIYSDVVESGSKTTQAVKSHHNVGGLPEDLQFELVEPVKYLFKDEVRACGLALGLPPAMIYRQPFPGPGLGVRCLGAITPARLHAVRESDAILQEEFARAGLAEKVWQYYTAVPDFRSTGVRDGSRTFEYPVILRAVNTADAMTASVERLDWDVLARITDRILAEVPGVTRVLYDLSPKPPATIEWE